MPRPRQNPESKPVQGEQINIIPAEEKKPLKKVLRVFNPAMAGKIIRSSYRLGDDEIPVGVKIDENGYSEEIEITEVYNELLSVGFKAA